MTKHCKTLESDTRFSGQSGKYIYIPHPINCDALPRSVNAIKLHLDAAAAEEEEVPSNLVTKAFDHKVRLTASVWRPSGNVVAASC